MQRHESYSSHMRDDTRLLSLLITSTRRQCVDGEYRAMSPVRSLFSAITVILSYARAVVRGVFLAHQVGTLA